MATPKPKVPHVSIPVILVALLLAAGAGLWVAQRKGGPSETPPSLPSPPVAKRPKDTEPPPPFPSGKNGATGQQMPAPAPLAAQVVPEAEQQKLHTWLTESETPEAAGQAMLADWKNLSERGKLEVAPHIINLVPDDKHQAIAQLLMAPETSPEVKELFFADVLNRPDEVKWPVIFDVLKDKSHPQSEQARNILTVVLGQDFGDDWAKWKERVDTELLKKGEK